MPTLNWIGKKAVENHHRQVPFHLLKEVPELSVGDPGSGNLLVEGDNLLALKALLPYYAGQVKCIYIDPPYNTGNEGWIYNDNVNSQEMREWLGKVVGNEKEDLSRHDKWLSMMYPRLQLLREFLRDDGSIFISIDDNEITNLRYIMDDIFGEKNFVATVIWEKVYSPKSTAKYLSENHDYILVYARRKEAWTRNLLPRTNKQDKRYKNVDNDPRGPWKPGDLSARNPYSIGVYPITCPSGRLISGPPKGMYWRVSKEKLDDLNADGRIWWGKHGNNVPAIKRFLSEVAEGIVPETIWTYQEAGHNQDAKKELLAILPDADRVFITPKPTQLIQRILQLATDKDSIILDSFAGSGSTGHAVLKKNRQDGGNRRFILVELEHTICKTITAKRIERASKGFGDTPGLGGGFRFATLGESLFNDRGNIRSTVPYTDLARHVYFTETGEPLPCKIDATGPLLGVCRGLAVYLLYNGILKDKSPNGGNVLTTGLLGRLPKHDGPKVVYGTACRIGLERLRRENIIFKQLPYKLRVDAL
jgi:site-specific DNA-methyltransferase (adenine-specific)/adenine-specific DNA-methyltransferase